MVVLGGGAVSYGRDTPVGVSHRPGLGSKLILHKVFSKSFRKCPFSHKSVNLFFMSFMVKDKFTDFWRSRLLQNDFKNNLREKRHRLTRTATEREGNNVRGLKTCSLKNGQSQG